MNRRAETLSKELLAWYTKNARDLPWRRTRDPYAILVSEIMLQQTQVDRVIPKYLEFLKLFPDFRTLAESKPTDVLRLWSGLGYNSRALRLRELANVVTREFGGSLPRDPETLLSLPGIGPYTQNAVLAFAFRKPVLARDTNVIRVLGRYFGREDFALPAPDWKLNHALMDIGASVCGRTPDCEACPLRANCVTKGRAAFEKTRKAAKPFEQTHRFVRGGIMRELLAQPHTPKTLFRKLRKSASWLNEKVFASILARLHQDGLIVLRGATVTLPN